MATYLFHSAVFMPDAYKPLIHRGKLIYSQHAQAEAQSDRYGEIKLPKTVNTRDAKLIECEYDPSRERVIKQVWRQRLDDKRDIVLAITDAGTVKTAWINLSSDQHFSLKRERYVTRYAVYPDGAFPDRNGA